MRLIFWLLLPAALMGGEQPASGSSRDRQLVARWRRRRALGPTSTATGFARHRHRMGGRRTRAGLPQPWGGKTKQPWPAVTVSDHRIARGRGLRGPGRRWSVGRRKLDRGKQRTLFVHWAPRELERYLDQRLAHRAIRLPEQLGMDVRDAGEHRRAQRSGPVRGIEGEAKKIGWWETPADAQARRVDLASVVRRRLDHVADQHDMDGDGDPDLVATDRKGPSSGILWIEAAGAYTASDRSAKKS
ncbi:MAG: hypothetical protein R2748_02215 [Bryobacterales bacterium]